MKVKVTASPVSGIVNAPSSKSEMQRYIAGALLAGGVSRIVSATLCDDSEAALKIACDLGAKVKTEGDVIEIHGGFNPVTGEISCGESGLSARMFTPIAALHNREISITGKGSLLKRPVEMVERPLADLGVSISSNAGYLPIKITGPMSGGTVKADGSVSSQFITGLLTALPVVEKDSILSVENLVSKPYIDLTLRILNEFGIKIVNDSYRVFTIEGRQKYRAGTFKPEGDWSGAAFLLVMGAIGGGVTVSGLDLDSVQADKAVIRALSLAGATVDISERNINVSGGDLKGFEFDISDCPDLAPPLTVMALACKGRSVLTGAERLVAKESNRGTALEETMRSLGGTVHFSGNRIEIEGGKRLKGGDVDAHNDHRIAMAMAVAAMVCDNPVTISGMECINKSYPGFIADFKRLNGNITSQ